MRVAKCIAGVKAKDVEGANKGSSLERNQNPRMAQTGGKDFPQDFELVAREHRQERYRDFRLAEVALGKNCSRH